MAKRRHLSNPLDNDGYITAIQHFTWATAAGSAFFVTCVCFRFLVVKCMQTDDGHYCILEFISSPPFLVPLLMYLNLKKLPVFSLESQVA